MTKSQLKKWLELGGEFNVEVGDSRFEEIKPLAEAAGKGPGKLILYKTERLYEDEISALCRLGAGHIAFPDKKLED